MQAPTSESPLKSEPSSGFVHFFSRYSTVLLKLAPGQEVSFEFIARRGIGKVRLLWFRGCGCCVLGFVAACLAVAPLRWQSLTGNLTGNLTRFCADARQVVSRRHRCVQIRGRHSPQPKVPSTNPPPKHETPNNNLQQA